MGSLPSERPVLRQRLGEEIERALKTCDELGETLAACYLQMAHDLCQPGASAVDSDPHTDAL